MDLTDFEHVLHPRLSNLTHRGGLGELGNAVLS